jgi:hypothetical protein
LFLSLRAGSAQLVVQAGSVPADTSFRHAPNGEKPKFFALLRAVPFREFVFAGREKRQAACTLPQTGVDEEDLQKAN